MSDNKDCPTLHQLSAEFKAFREWTKDMLSEREKLGIERGQRLDARIDAMKEQTVQAFGSSEKAIEKAESAQREYNVRSNEFRAALDDAQKNTVSIARFDDFRKEYDGYKSTVAGEIRSLRESRSSGEGRSAGSAATWATVIAISGLIFGGIGALIGKLLK